MKADFKAWVYFPAQYTLLVASTSNHYPIVTDWAKNYVRDDTQILIQQDLIEERKKRD